jgi:hypothetical protein
MFRYAVIILSLLAAPALAAPAQTSGKSSQTQPQSQHKPPPVKPSFDCSKVKSKPLEIICTNDDLARLDLQEDALLHRARAKAVSPDAVDADQDLFISRRAACGTAGCIAAVYRARIRELHDWAN